MGNPLAATVRAGYTAPYELRNVEVQCELLLAVLAMKNILRHRHSPVKSIALFACSENRNRKNKFFSAEEKKWLFAGFKD